MNLASVVVCARNAAATLGATLESVLANDYDMFEVLVVDDCSTDQTGSVALSYARRHNVRVLRTERPLGAGGARNMGIRNARGDAVFFIDADCRAERRWISEGMLSLKEPNVVAVEGSVYYANSRPLFSEQVPLNPFYRISVDGCRTIPGRDYSSGSFAVKRRPLNEAGGFNGTRYRLGREDTDLGLRLRELGEVAFNKRMRVTHCEQRWRLVSLLRNALRYEADVRLSKDYGSFFFLKGRVLHPYFLALLLCPPLIFFHYRLTTLEELLFVPKFYCYLVLLRLVIWRSALREGVLII